MNRRDMMAGMAGAAAMLTGATGKSGAASSTPSVSTLEPLVTAGLDPLTVFRKMFASAEKSGACYWFYAGVLPTHIENLGPMYLKQEESFCATKIEDLGRDSFRMDQHVAGIFRDMQTSDITDSQYDPRTGKSTAFKPAFQFAPTHLTVTKSREGLSFLQTYASVSVLGVKATAEIKDDRVSLTTDTEYLYSANGTKGQVATLKIYSSLGELKSGAPYVASQGYYSTCDRETRVVEVSGVMQKAKVDEKLDPLAWDRIRSFFPQFFDGDRISVN